MVRIVRFMEKPFVRINGAAPEFNEIRGLDCDTAQDYQRTITSLMKNSWIVYTSE